MQSVGQQCCVAQGSDPEGRELLTQVAEVLCAEPWCWGVKKEGGGTGPKGTSPPSVLQRSAGVGQGSFANSSSSQFQALLQGEGWIFQMLCSCFGVLSREWGPCTAQM